MPSPIPVTPVSSLMVCMQEDEHTLGPCGMSVRQRTQCLSRPTCVLPNFHEAWLQSVKKSPGTAIAWQVKPQAQTDERSPFQLRSEPVQGHGGAALSPGLSPDESTWGTYSSPVCLHINDTVWLCSLALCINQRLAR